MFIPGGNGKCFEKILSEAARYRRALWSAAACCRFDPASLLAALSSLGRTKPGPGQQAGLRESGIKLPHSKMRGRPHSPVHRLSQPGAYMVTAGTYLKHPVFRGPERLKHLCDMLLELAEKYG